MCLHVADADADADTDADADADTDADTDAHMESNKTCETANLVKQNSTVSKFRFEPTNREVWIFFWTCFVKERKMRVRTRVSDFLFKT